MPVPAARSPHLAAAESGQASGPAPAAGLPGPAAPVASGRSPGPGPPASGECPLPPPRSQRTAAALFVRGGGAARSRPFARCPCGQTARPSRRSPGAAVPPVPRCPSAVAEAGGRACVLHCGLERAPSWSRSGHGWWAGMLGNFGEWGRTGLDVASSKQRGA